jgi:predicted HTH transcriptional regulator
VCSSDLEDVNDMKTFDIDIKVAKNRIGMVAKNFRLNVKYHSSENKTQYTFVEYINKEKNIKEQNKEEILELFNNHDKLSIKNIDEYTGLPKRSITRYLQELIKELKIVRIADGVYSLRKISTFGNDSIENKQEEKDI